MTASSTQPIPEPPETALPIGEFLLQRGLITRQDLDKALSFQRQYKGRLGSVLVRLGALSEDPCFAKYGPHHTALCCAKSNGFIAPQRGFGADVMTVGKPAFLFVPDVA